MRDPPQQEDAPLPKVNGKTLLALMKDLDDPDSSVKQQAVRNIVGFGPAAREAMPHLIRIASEREPDVGVRADAVAALGIISAMEGGIALDDVPDVVKALSALLGRTESQHTVRLQAELALARLGPKAKAATPLLADNSRYPFSWEVRKAACYALGRIGPHPAMGPDPLSLEALLGALGDKVAPVRLEAILALSALGRPRDPKALAAEKEALRSLTEKDPANNVAIWARVLLMFLDPKEVTLKNIASLETLLRMDPDAKVRLDVARALFLLQDDEKIANEAPEAVKAIKKLLSVLDLQELNRRTSTTLPVSRFMQDNETGADPAPEPGADPELERKLRGGAILPFK
jgi:HEAT repeat protein